ncbi:MAG: GAF and ANTAR domain-containing protein, partial [Acidimicrobiales bacterium]
MAPDTSSLLDALASFARTLAHDYEISDALHDLTTRTAAGLEVAGAGVSLVEGDRLRFVTSDTGFVADMERIQEEHQAGPCVDAVRTLAPVMVSDVASEVDRWPHYCSQARAWGIVAVAGIPIRNTNLTGSINLYDTKLRSWSDEDLAVAGVFADIAASYVANASKLDQERRTNEQLQRALESRVIIEQAKGIIANHANIGVDQAFHRLRKHANDHNATLRATAEAVI